MKTWLEKSGGSETNVGAFLLTKLFVGTKYPKDITLCDSNTVILLITVITINIHVSIYLEKNISWIFNPKKIPCGKLVKF